MFLTPAHLLFLHSRLIDELGGEAGLRDRRALSAALEEPREVFFGRPVDRYREEKAAALLHALARRRPFTSLNEATALSAALLFLERNGLQLKLDEEETAQLLAAVVGGHVSVRETGRWLRARAEPLAEA
ncbi:MAG: Fic family protein [Planctomycetota bacterium]